MPSTIRYLSIFDDTLLDCGLRANVIKIDQQVWKPEDSYLGYIHHPRPSSGLILICADIEMVFTYAGGELCAHRGDAVYVPGGLQYRVTFKGSAPDSRLDSYTVNFDLLDRDNNKILLSNNILLLASDHSRRYSPLAAELYEAYHVKRIGMTPNELKIEAIFLYLLDRVITDARGKKDFHYPIRKGVRALTAEWNRNTAIGEYATLCDISESYFYLLFKRSMGVSPVEYRNRIRISNACSMLEETTLSIDEIAVSVGFDTPFYFSRIFKKIMKQSPTQYRQAHQK